MEKETDYYAHLVKISLLGKLYKRSITSPVIHYLCCKFGSNFLEVGCGIGSGFLGAYPDKVTGLEINERSVQHCKENGLSVEHLSDNNTFKFPDSYFDACVLDNVLEHIESPKVTLDECYRVTKHDGGMVILVPGHKGFKSDIDHKKFYNHSDLATLDSNWRLVSLFSTPFIFQSDFLSKRVKQYCLVATYKKIT